MFAAYSYNSGISQANFLSDVVAIITGETNVNNLSSGCNKAASSILTTYNTSGWAVHDSAAATNRVVVKAPCADGVKTKYVILDTQTTGKLSHGGAETWDATTHSGTNFLAGTSFTNINNITAGFDTSSGTLFIYADVHNIIMTFKTTGAMLGISAPAIEFTRDSSIANISKGYPCWGAVAPSTQIVSSPRIKNMVASGDMTAANARIYMASIYGSGVNVSSIGRDETESTIISTLPPYSAFISNAIYFGSMNIDAVFAHPNVGAELDEMIVNSKTYIRWAVFGSMYVIWTLKG